MLSWPDLSRLLGSVVRFPYPQRQELERVATPANIQALARLNAEQIQTVLDGINAQEPVLPDSSGRRLKLRLAQRIEMKLWIHPSG